jgi:hypothetical protein
LLEDTNCTENHKQPHGKGIGSGGAPNPKMHHGGSPHIFHFPPSKGSHEWSHTTKSGPYRLSGQKGAHMLGRRGK